MVALRAFMASDMCVCRLKGDHVVDAIVLDMIGEVTALRVQFEMILRLDLAVQRMLQVRVERRRLGMEVVHAWRSHTSVPFDYFEMCSSKLPRPSSVVFPSAAVPRIATE